jgi:DNA-binding transcriptional ArsR family regulator
MTLARDFSGRGRGKMMAAGPSKKERDANAKVAAYCLALSSPVRVRILKLLLDEECVFGDLAKKIPLAQSTISQHLSILKAAGLISSETNGQSTCYCVERGEVDKMKAIIDAL